MKISDKMQNKQEIYLMTKQIFSGEVSYCFTSNDKAREILKGIQELETKNDKLINALMGIKRNTTDSNLKDLIDIELDNAR